MDNNLGLCFFLCGLYRLGYMARLQRKTMSDFINESAVKKLIHANDKRCSDEFLTALDAFVKSKVQACCDARNGGAKTLDESVVTNTASAAASENLELVKEIKNEAVSAELKANKVITVADLRRFIRVAKSNCDVLLGVKQ